MIVRDEWDYAKLNGPLLYRVPIYPPFSIGIEEGDRTKIFDHQLLFAPELDDRVHDPDVYIKVWDVPWRWYCQSCYCASGDQRDVFHTIWVRREELDGKGNRNSGGWFEPSYFQRQEMSDHGKQHSIMWSWARSVDK